MLGPIVSGQRRFHLRRRTFLHPMIAQLGQLPRIAFAGHDGIEDAQPAHAVEVAHCVMQMQIHLLQGFLHMLNLAASSRDHVIAMPLQAAQLAD